jgi:lauroyl/myristoyl acyltransferase/mitochondrial fission protein ELM1
MKSPLWVAYFLGRLIGLFLYWHPRKRRVAFRNIKSAFPQKSSSELFLILKKSFHYMALNIIENLIAPRIYPYVTIKGEENIVSPKGIFVGIHAGNWETAISLFAHSQRFAVFAKHQKNKALDRFITEVREQGKIHVCFSLKELIRCLRNGYTIGLVIDHGAEKDAIVVNFFSHLVPTPKGAVYLARKFNLMIYPDFCYRQKLFSHVSEIGKPIDPRGKEYGEILGQLNKIYENYLEKYPWEYFWYYKRFKRKKNRNVVILSDGKSGHIRQSKAFLSFLLEEPYPISVKIIDISYRKGPRRIIADMLAFFCGRNSLWGGWVLPFLVDKKTWENLDHIYADIVISTGSLVAPINKLFSSYIGAKSVSILRPNIPLAKFNIAVVPEHDRIQADNAAVIKGALYYPENINDKAEDCKRFFNLNNMKKISFFAGGPLGDDREFMANLKDFVVQLKKFSLRKDYKILVSTSRRTPPEAEDYLEKELRDFVNTEAIVIANRNNYDFIFEGFVVSSDIVFVTNESISMISEIASLNKPCVCVFLATEYDKHKVFLESMQEEITFLRKPYDIPLIKPKASAIFEKNKNRIKEAIGKIISKVS